MSITENIYIVCSCLAILIMFVGFIREGRFTIKLEKDVREHERNIFKISEELANTLINK